jgi:16S rRNA pseudouridine516 synthase
MHWAELLFSQGFGTRRECAARVAAGRVGVPGRVAGVDDEIEPADGFAYEVDGHAWTYHARALLVLHKPAGFECSQRPRHHPSVLTLLPPPLRTRGVQPVGRLDADTTGVLLLTDDGPLIHRLTSPKHHVPKVYEVQCKHAIEGRQIDRLLHGVVLDDDPRPVRAVAAEALAPAQLSLTLTEGKYHQVKRMVAAVGNRVDALHRSAFGTITLDGLATPGQWRWIGADERAALEHGRAAPPA